MGKKLYFECSTGIAGDMAVASLLDLGASEEGLFRTLKELNLDGYEASVETFMNNSIRTKRFSVALEDPSHPDVPDAENFDPRDDEESNLIGHDHIHSSDHEHGHSHEHEHGHSHDHIHRNLDDVTEILHRLEDYRVCDLALRIFRIVAEAEASVHGKPVDEVHFHEVGAVDSIVDIVSAAYCLVNLDIEEVLLRTVNEGFGTIHCAHGDLPVPVPAVLAIADRYHLPMKFIDVEGELVTPTGAAIAAVLWKGNGLPEAFSIEKTGYASGHRKYKTYSLLRAMMIREDEASHEPHHDGAGRHGHHHASLCRLETNIDDCTGEALGYVMEKLLAAGARDVFYTPVYMKKNRPAYMLTTLCNEADVPAMEQIIFTHTTTIGIRKNPVFRDCLPREIMTISTPYGDADVKVCYFEGRTFAYPEYESVRKICENSDLSYQEAAMMIQDCFAGKDAMK
ncbi:MAG: nickel pincer cofactor biosynthesis protein LarC [Lachnospiraceae bacterium]|nr:nickel pincer cofactor biosynthesis protein LarC [Lachnospiraceae bacterium]